MTPNNFNSDQGPDWSPQRVVQVVRAATSLTTLSYAAYFPRLFQDGLESGIEHPSEIRFEPAAVAVPTRFSVGSNEYWLPGSPQDLLHYASCLVACIPAIRRAWEDQGRFADLGPPTRQELALGLVGDMPWAYYWNSMHRCMDEFASQGFGWVLSADVKACAASIDTALLTRQLSNAGADPDAVRLMGAMHGVWHKQGFPGLPVLGSFSLLARMHFMEVERRLHDQGIVFVRVLDDFRILCRSPAEKAPAIAALTDALASCRLHLNEDKTLFYRKGDARTRWKNRRLMVRGKLKQGIARPALVRALKWRAARPAALAALTVLNKFTLKRRSA